MPTTHKRTTSHTEHPPHKKQTTSDPRLFGKIKHYSNVVENQQAANQTQREEKTEACDTYTKNQNLFCKAVQKGETRKVEKLLARGANPIEKNIYGQTPLYMGVQANQPHIVTLCITHILSTQNIQAYIDATTAEGMEPLHLAIWTGYSTLVEVLLRRWDIDLEKTDIYGRTPLDIAIQSGRIEIVQRLASTILLLKKIDIEKLQKAIPHSLPKNPLLPPSQNWLISRMRPAGYKANEIGICHGYAPAGLQAFYQGKAAVKKFDARLEYIYDTPPAAFPKLQKRRARLARLNNCLQKMCHISLPLLVQEIQQGKSLQRYKAILLQFPDITKILQQTKKDPRAGITDIFAFFESIELYQQAALYPDWFTGIDCYHVLHSVDLENVRGSLHYPCYVYIKPEALAEEKIEIAQLVFLRSPKDTGTPISYDAQQCDPLLQRIEQASHIRLDAKEAEVFGTRLFPEVGRNGQDISAAPFLRSIQMEKAGMCLTKTDSFSGVFTEEALAACFTRLTQHATQPIGLLIHNASHTLSIGYDPTENIWIYFNADTPGERYILGTEVVAQTIFSSLSYSSAATAVVLEIDIMQTEALLRPDIRAWREDIGQDLLAVTPEKAVFLDEVKASWLYMAVYTGDIETTTALLHAGAHIHLNRIIQTRKETTLLSVAIEKNDAHIVRLLLTYGADPNQPDSHTLLSDATKKGNPDIVQALLHAQGIYPYLGQVSDQPKQKTDLDSMPVSACIETQLPPSASDLCAASAFFSPLSMAANTTAAVSRTSFP